LELCAYALYDFLTLKLDEDGCLADVTFFLNSQVTGKNWKIRLRKYSFALSLVLGEKEE